MITMYQELIPLSNKMYEAPVSKDGAYTNPVIVPFVFNATGASNIMETLIWVRNDSQEKYYTDIVISLMKESGSSPVNTTGTLDFSNGITFTVNGCDPIEVEPGFLYSQTVTGSRDLENKYKSTYVPVIDDGTVSVKFSYGEDELSLNEWNGKKSIMVIPMIGTPGMANTSYIPIRMRMEWKTVPSLFTIRDYFIDVSFVSEITI